MQTKTYSNQQELTQLNALLAARLDELLRVLGIQLSQGYNKYSGSCPIHLGADNPSAFTISLDDKYGARYTCWSHSCQNIFKSSLLGLVRAKISKDTYGWRGIGDKIAPFWSVIEWVENFLGIKKHQINIQFNNIIKSPSAKIQTVSEIVGYPREKVRKCLKIPCPFMLKKGFSAKILNEYDIGLCENPLQKFYWRSVLPCYDSTNVALSGITGRSNWLKCEHCSLYHNSEKSCPKPEHRSYYAKWRHSYKFNTGYYLYNFFKEFDLIEDRRRVILVESPGNALKLIQNGLRNVCATFGCRLTHDQSQLLNRAKVNTVLIMFDNDEAGRNGAAKIEKEFGNFYNIKSLFPYPENKDLCDLSDEEIKCNVLPCIKIKK